MVVKRLQRRLTLQVSVPVKTDDGKLTSNGVCSSVYAKQRRLTRFFYARIVLETALNTWESLASLGDISSGLQEVGFEYLAISLLDTRGACIDVTRCTGANQRPR